jgi:hypothetical protein
VELEDNQVAYRAILDSVALYSGSSSSGETSGSESILCSPPPVPNLPVSVRVLPMMEVPEAEVAGLGTAAEARDHMAATEGLLSLAS